VSMIMRKRTIKNALCVGRSLTTIFTGLSTMKKKTSGYTETTPPKRQKKHSTDRLPSMSGHGLNFNFMKPERLAKTKKTNKHWYPYPQWRTNLKLKNGILMSSHMWEDKGHEYRDEQAFAVERPYSFRDEIAELESKE